MYDAKLTQIEQVLPAHAGMIRQIASRTDVLPCAPRSRGDDPNSYWFWPQIRECSPLTRG